MQSAFAMQQSKADDLKKQEKFLFLSFDNIYKLYALLLLLLIELKNRAETEIETGLKKNIPTEEDLDPNHKFTQNKVLIALEKNSFLNTFKKKYRLKKWDIDVEIVQILWQNIKKNKFYSAYMSSSVSSFKEDKELILDIYKNVIAPETALHDSFEADESQWSDDIAIANTMVMKTISGLKQNSDFDMLPDLFKDVLDREFAIDLFRKVILNDKDLAGLLVGKTPNWDFERISEIDKLIMKMAIAEFLYFPSIPTNVSINEYVEIAKEFSTPKSNVFINGVLHSVYKELIENDRLKKNIRGRN